MINGNERMKNYKAFVLWMPCHINQYVFNDIKVKIALNKYLKMYLTILDSNIFCL